MTGPAAGEPVRFDPGLQPERTALSWQRTTLSLLLCSVAGARLLTTVLGGWAVLVGVAGAGATALVAVLARRRGERRSAHLLAPTGPGAAPAPAMPDGLHVAWTAGLVLAAGFLGTAYVLWRILV